ncbi:MAG: serine hydroxymethyltransferase [Candidatus Kerfeldbacteria bacterium]|nr:serine hydroxymethyltransferase [Candidatus Kerfeldbacteria bacterium]
MPLPTTLEPRLRNLLRAELKRQREGLTLIASENYTSPAVLKAIGTVLTNKYSEGYPGRRYYGGNQVIDQIEQLAIDRVKKLFGAEHANVQSHAGAIANIAVYFAFLKPGDTVLSMELRAGGHLTMGHSRNISGQYFRIVPYGVDTNGYIDYDEVERLANQHHPKMIISGASAYPRIIDFQRFGAIAKSVSAIHMADIAHLAGLVAAGLHPSPVPHADVVTMTTHKTLRGPRGAIILCRQPRAALIDKAVMPGIQGGPLEHIIAGKAQAFHEALQPSFKTYQQQIIKNAAQLASDLGAHGLKLSTGGTDNHLVLTDVTPFGLTGATAEKLLEEVGIYANKNLIPNDPRKPLDPSGIRLGTPAITTRGLKEPDVEVLAHLIIERLTKPTSQSVKRSVAAAVRQLTRKFPIYPDL